MLFEGAADYWQKLNELERHRHMDYLNALSIV